MIHYMPHVSRIKLDKKTERNLIRNLSLILARIKKEDEMNSFLFSLLTPTEQLMLAKRIAIIILLKEGVAESHISSALHVTRVTVSRLQFFWEARGGGYGIALKVLENEKLMREFKDGLLKLVAYSIRAAGGYVKPTIV